jgi:hypothetical protein
MAVPPRCAKSDSISRFSASERVAQAEISSRLRRQPRHHPVAGSMAQIFVQGEETTKGKIVYAGIGA